MLEKLTCMPHEIPNQIIDLLVADYSRRKKNWDKMIFIGPSGEALLDEAKAFIKDYEDNKDKIDLKNNCKFRRLDVFDSIFLITFIDEQIDFSDEALMAKVRVLDPDNKYYTLINLNGIIQSINENKMINVLKVFFGMYSEVYPVSSTESNSASLNSLTSLVAYIEAMYCRLFSDEAVFRYDASDPIFKALIDSRYANYEPLIKDVIKSFKFDYNQFKMIYYNASKLAEIGFMISQPFYDRWMIINIMNKVFTDDKNIKWRKEIREILSHDEYSDKEKFERIFTTAPVTKKIVEILYSKEKDFITKEIRQIITEIDVLAEQFPEKDDPSVEEVEDKYNKIKKDIDKLIPASENKK